LTTSCNPQHSLAIRDPLARLTFDGAGPAPRLISRTVERTLAGSAKRAHLLIIPLTLVPF